MKQKSLMGLERAKKDDKENDKKVESSNNLKQEKNEKI